MVKYKQYCCYINRRYAGMPQHAPVYSTIAKLFRERDSLAKKILEEMNKDLLTPVSEAGADFCFNHRTISKDLTYLNRFLRRLQEDFNANKKTIASQRILDTKPQSINSSCSKCPYANGKSGVSQQTYSKLEAQVS